MVGLGVSDLQTPTGLTYRTLQIPIAQCALINRMCRPDGASLIEWWFPHPPVWATFCRAFGTPDNEEFAPATRMERFTLRNGLLTRAAFRIIVDRFARQDFQIAQRFRLV